MAERLVPKIMTGKEVEGDQSLGKGASPWICCIQTLLKQETSTGVPHALPPPLIF